MPDVRLERSNWRDEALSKRHRLWGWDCPAVDLDFVMLEYDKSLPVAVIEYKNENAKPVDKAHPSMRAMAELANRAQIPFFVCKYQSRFQWFEVTAMNIIAIPKISISKKNSKLLLTEEQYVRFLYFLRGRAVPPEVMQDIRKAV
ncbi:hypothetical protein LJC49_09795 [Ruminococcaceae bacterium OttesenSCG-928-I18]|nr:hypothetical protein [Ruminococcaceae bacterium OttesenSCG-928-I18]